MSPPFRRVLIANRGEIAVRIIRACHELGIEAVAVHSDADVDAPHTRAADLSVRVGPAPASDSYLRVDGIIAAARETGADALHPGYGFLSERPVLATACAEAGVVFIGPRAETLATLGDKLAARRAAAAAGVPVVPGTLEPARIEPEALDGLVARADEVGWPLLVKAAAGGGGRGMRRVDRDADLAEALVSASREALAAFGDGSVYLERLVEGGRHVEVQLLGDRSGEVVALGERDCSVQRRHQKLVEEAPAPGLDEAARRELHAMAVDVARVVGLENAATAEFLLDRDGRFWFLEVNARLQVEHGVTELVSGVDLVHEQFRVAAGQPLSEHVRGVAENAVRPERHAIEVRLNAEDPARGFAPLPGQILDWQMPGGPGVRVDAGVEAGSRVSSEYDSLLAKLLVVAVDRGAALGRLRRALDETAVLGLQTTLPFHRWLAGSAAFGNAELSTDFVERNWVPEPLRQAATEHATELVAAAATRSRGSSPDLFGGARRVSPSSRDGEGWAVEARREAVERWPT